MMDDAQSLQLELKYKWSVVQFIEISEAGGEISTVPTSWVFEEDGLYFSWWPKNDVRHSIKKASAPSENWSKHPVLILSQTDSYDMAILFEKKKEQSTTDSEQELGKGNRKKRKIEYSGYSSASDLEEMPPPPPKLKRVVEKGSSSSKETPARIIEEQIIHMHENLAEVETVNDYASSSSTATVTVSSASSVTTNELENSQKMMKNILDNVLAVRTILTEQNKFLTTLSGGAPSVVESFEEVPKKPFKKFKKLLIYDRKIMDQEGIQKQLILFLSLCGGMTAKDNIRRGLQKIFDDSLATRCSWTGRKNNYQLRNLKIIELLKVAVRKNFSLTDHLFQEVVSNWFRQSELRLTRKQNAITND